MSHLSERHSRAREKKLAHELARLQRLSSNDTWYLSYDEDPNTPWFLRQKEGRRGRRRQARVPEETELAGAEEKEEWRSKRRDSSAVLMDELDEFDDTNVKTTDRAGTSTPRPEPKAKAAKKQVQRTRFGGEIPREEAPKSYSTRDLEKDRQKCLERVRSRKKEERKQSRQERANRKQVEERNSQVSKIQPLLAKKRILSRSQSLAREEDEELEKLLDDQETSLKAMVLQYILRRRENMNGQASTLPRHLEERVKRIMASEYSCDFRID